MTTPDPFPGSRPAADDPTTAFDPVAPLEAGLAGGTPAAPDGPATPWPASDAAPWPPVQPPAEPSTPWPPAAAQGASAPSQGASAAAVPAASVPPASAVPPAGASAPPPGSVPPTTTPLPARRSTPPGLVAGVILVIIGAALLLGRVVEISFGGVTWPLWIVVPGVAMLVGSFFIPRRGGVGLAVPGAIVTIVGLVLWVQAVYDLYATWAYAWALVAPTGPGIGMLLYGLVQRDGELVADGFRTTLVGLGLFLGFALFFEGIVGLSGDPIPNLDQLAPYGIIGLGVLLVALSFVGTGRRGEDKRTGA